MKRTTAVDGDHNWCLCSTETSLTPLTPLSKSTSVSSSPCAKVIHPPDRCGISACRLTHLIIAQMCQIQDAGGRRRQVSVKMRGTVCVTTIDVLNGSATVSMHWRMSSPPCLQNEQKWLEIWLQQENLFTCLQYCIDQHLEIESTFLILFLWG